MPNLSGQLSQYVLLAVCLGLLNFTLFAWSRPDVERWIAENGFRLIHWRRQYLLFGNAAYKITVEDDSGRKRTAIMHAPTILSAAVDKYFGFGVPQPKLFWLD